MYSKADKPKIGDIVTKLGDISVHLSAYTVGIVARVLSYDHINLLGYGKYVTEIDTVPCYPIQVVFIKQSQLQTDRVGLYSISCALTEVTRCTEDDLAMLTLGGHITPLISHVLTQIRKYIVDNRDKWFLKDGLSKINVRDLSEAIIKDLKLKTHHV